MSMKHLDLFSGIGGFALAARWMGWQTVQFVEIDSFCQKVLNKNFPNVPIHGDIKTFDGTELRGTVDILTGGFPCQPFSGAGKRKGKEDDRHLWPEMLRVIAEVQPTYIVGENVYGLVNWSDGVVFDEVQTSLETAGFEVTSCVLPACGLNAPHRRDRVWIIAYREDEGSIRRFGESPNGTGCSGQRRVDEGTGRGNAWNEVIANNNNKRLQGSSHEGGVSESRKEPHKQPTGLFCTRWSDFPTQSPVCRRDDGIPNRVDRIKSLGNAIVPQVAFEIFKAIQMISV
jgi:DNA (cytosine-5)-methyltransferase 1